MASLTLATLPGGEDAAGSPGPVCALAAPGCAASPRRGPHSRPGVRDLRGQRPGCPGRGRGDTWVPVETPLPTPAPRGCVETPPALLRPGGGGRFSPQLDEEPRLRRPSQTLLASALKLKRHREPLRERPVPASRTCPALPGGRGAGRGRPLGPRPRTPAAAVPLRFASRQWTERSGGGGGLGSCLASPALDAPGQEGSGRRERGAGPRRATPWTPAPRHLDAERGRV